MHLTEAQINDLVDETLSDDEQSRVLTHISACAECRAEVDALRHVLHRVGQLPTSIQPQRDLRPATWAKSERKTLWSFRYPLAAAAVLLIALSSAITYFVTRDDESGPVVRMTQTQNTNTVDLVSLERQYSNEVEELQRALRQNREALSPETIRILEENLRIIDSAINEARAALTNDPASHTLGEMLKSAYQRKLDLLKQAARSTAAAT
jgi:hypothetical protein